MDSGVRRNDTRGARITDAVFLDVPVSYFPLFLLIILSGCAELRTSRPAARPASRPAIARPGEPEKVTSPAGVEREVVRLQRPQLVSLRTPQRLASAEIVSMGKDFLSRHEFDKALQMFQEAVTIDGTNGVAYYYLARTRYELKQYDQAMGLLERAESLLADSQEWLDNVTELRTIIHAAALKK